MKRSFLVVLSTSFAGCLLGVLLTAGAWCAAPALAPSSSAENSAHRLREGTRLLQAAGEFQATGDRVTFVGEALPPLRVLENLTLERVVQTLSERGGGREWTVNGVITEYRGVNFLLLSRASLKTKRAD